MDFYHSRILSTEALQSTLKPHSEWVKAHAAQISAWPEKLAYLTISDVRTSTLNFSALRHAVQTAMGQKCIRIEWVAEGGGNLAGTLPESHIYFAMQAWPLISEFSHTLRLYWMIMKLLCAFFHIHILCALERRSSRDLWLCTDSVQNAVWGMFLLYECAQPLLLFQVATMCYIRTHAVIPMEMVCAYDDSPCMFEEVVFWPVVSMHYYNAFCMKVVIGQKYKLDPSHYGS